MGMGFHPTNDLHQCLKMVRLFFLDLWIWLKTMEVVCSLANCNGLK